VTVATTTITPETMMVIIQFISILVYLRANWTAQGPITKWVRLKGRSKSTQSTKQGDL
jgi:hypothetical protein